MKRGLYKAIIRTPTYVLVFRQRRHQTDVRSQYAYEYSGNVLVRQIQTPRRQDHYSTLSAEVKSTWIYTSTPSYVYTA
jgi:hypothetical protein